MRRMRGPSAVQFRRFLTRGHFLASVSFSGRIFGLSDYRLLLIWPTEEEEETEQNSAADSHNTFTAERKIRIRGHEASFKVSNCLITHAHFR